MRKTLHDYELKYSTIEKQVFSLVKEVAHFRTYILSTHVVAYVPHSLVKMLLNQQFREGRWENWLEKLQEYDIEIKPLKVVKGQGLCKLITGIEAVNISSPHIDDATIQDLSISGSKWYKDIVFYLKLRKFPVGMSSKERISLKMKTNQYVLVSRVLFRRNLDGILLRCLDPSKPIKPYKNFMKEFVGDTLHL
jgi:hypothetical protein